MSSLKQFLAEATGKVWLLKFDNGDKRDGDLDQLKVFSSEKKLVDFMVETMDPDIVDLDVEAEADKLTTVKAVISFISKYNELGIYEDVFETHQASVDK